MKKIHEDLNKELLCKMPMNNEKTRDYVKTYIQRELNNSSVEIKCDSENNYPEVVDLQCIVVRLAWKNTPESTTYNYSYWTFGNSEARKKLLTMARAFA